MTQGVLKTHSSDRKLLPKGFRAQFTPVGVFYEHATYTPGADYQAKPLEDFVREQRVDPTTIEGNPLRNYADILVEMLRQGAPNGTVIVVKRSFNSIPRDVRRVVGGEYGLFKVYVRKNEIERFNHILE